MCQFFSFIVSDNNNVYYYNAKDRIEFEGEYKLDSHSYIYAEKVPKTEQIRLMKLANKLSRKYEESKLFHHADLVHKFEYKEVYPGHNRFEFHTDTLNYDLENSHTVENFAKNWILDFIKSEEWKAIIKVREDRRREERERRLKEIREIKRQERKALRGITKSQILSQIPKELRGSITL